MKQEARNKQYSNRLFKWGRIRPGSLVTLLLPNQAKPWQSWCSLKVVLFSSFVSNSLCRQVGICFNDRYPRDWVEFHLNGLGSVAFNTVVIAVHKVHQHSCKNKGRIKMRKLFLNFFSFSHPFIQIFKDCCLLTISRMHTSILVSYENLMCIKMGLSSW